MEIAILILIIVCILMQIFMLAVLYGRNPEKSRSAMQELLRRMQKEEQTLRKEQAARTNETIQLSMQMVNENLSHNQAQTRDTTAAQLRQFEDRIQGLEAANNRSMAALHDTITQQMELLRAQNEKRLREIQKTVDDTLQEHLERKMKLKVIISKPVPAKKKINSWDFLWVKIVSRAGFMKIKVLL